MSGSLSLVPFLENFCWFALPNFYVMIFVLSYYVLLLLFYYPFETCSFLMKKRKGMDLDGSGGVEKLRGVEEEGTIVVICKKIIY